MKNKKFSLYQSDGVWGILEDATNDGTTCVKSYFGADLIVNRMNDQSEQIRSLEEQLKNAIVPKFKSNDVAWRIHWYTKEIERVVIVNTEIKIVVDTKIIYLIAVLEEGITLDNLDKKFFNNPDTDLVEESKLFATREEAEKRLAELEGK